MALLAVYRYDIHMLSIIVRQYVTHIKTFPYTQLYKRHIIFLN